MKKLFSLLLALCLLCVSAAALAETVELDGLTFELNNGEYFVKGEKTDQVYLQIYPFFSKGDGSTNITVSYVEGASSYTADQFKDAAGQIEEVLKSGLEAQGIQVDSVTMKDPYEATLNDVPCIAIEFEMQVSAYGMSLAICERLIALGKGDYLLAVTAMNQDDLDTATAQMADSMTIQ